MFKVKMVYPNGSESECVGLRQLVSLSEAELAIKGKQQQDVGMGVRVVYRVYEWDDIVKEYAPGALLSSGSGESQGGKGSGATFSPTPLNSAPRPPGTPHNWVKDEEDKGKG